MKTKDLLLCSLFAALVAVGAFIRIPVQPIAFTLQTELVLLTGLLLGPKRGAISIGVYVFLGLIGLPIFSAGGGIGYVLSPTFGYLPGFIVAAYLCGRLITGQPSPGYRRLLAASLAGIAVIYLLGVTYFIAVSYLYIKQSAAVSALVIANLLPFLPIDIILASGVAALAKRLLPVINNI